MSKLSDAIRRFRRSLEREERTAANTLVTTYAGAYRRMALRLEDLLREMVIRQAAGRVISRDWLFQRERTLLLLQQVEQELDAFAGIATERIITSQRRAVFLAAEASAELIRLSPGPAPLDRIPPGFGAFNPLAIEAIASRTAAGSPVRKLFERYGDAGAKMAREILAGQAALGRNPRETASVLKKELKIPLARALTISRTETLSAYREASIEAYKQTQVVRRWRWTAALNPRTCGMCLGMDGREFPLETPFGSHPNCRCTPVPVTPSWEEMGIPVIDRRPNLPLGEKWFANQPESVQVRVLGKAKLKLYQEGRLSLETLIGYRRDKEWGPNRWERSLKDIREGNFKPPKSQLGVS